jgi:hypothetical protein
MLAYTRQARDAFVASREHRIRLKDIVHCMQVRTVHVVYLTSIMKLLHTAPTRPRPATPGVASRGFPVLWSQSALLFFISTSGDTQMRTDICITSNIAHKTPS